MDPWLWLTRTWPADLNRPDTGGRWGGLTRSLARVSADPAAVVCRGPAVDAICHAVEEELCRPLPRGPEVPVAEGEFGEMGDAGSFG